MIELSIPEISENSRHVKDRVISILAIEQPLSIMEISNKIRGRYNITVTYQAVRKAIEYLKEKEILSKNKKKYSINKKWVIQIKSFFDKVLIQYENRQKIHEFKDSLVHEDYALYTFTNILDLDNFWGDVMDHWANNIKKEKTKEYFGIYHYGFWHLINLGRETKLFENFSKKNIKSHIICFNEYPLNRWGVNLYKSSGVKVKFSDKRDIDEFTGINVLGDIVVQVKYPKKIIYKLKKFYKKYHSVQEMNLQEITQITHEPCEIRFILFKNSSIAKSLRDKYRQEFK